ncbi:MAG TPA: rod shape-determining protein MreC, partial [Caulobacter sp.]
KDFAQLADEKQLQTRSLPPVTTEDPKTSILSAPAPITRPPAAPAVTAPATTAAPRPAAPRPAAPRPVAPAPAPTPAPAGDPQ